MSFSIDSKNKKNDSNLSRNENSLYYFHSSAAQGTEWKFPFIFSPNGWLLLVLYLVLPRTCRATCITVLLYYCNSVLAELRVILYYCIPVLAGLRVILYCCITVLLYLQGYVYYCITVCLYLQGYVCRDCGLVTHKPCHVQVSSHCDHSTLPALDL